MSGLLKALMASSLVQKMLSNQLSTLAGAGAMFVVSHHAAAGYTQDQLVGALVCIGAVGLQFAENQIRKPAAPK